MANLVIQLHDYRLTTAKIIYRMPDHIHLLQEFIWQDYDIAPQYPRLEKFVDFWMREIEGPLHSVHVMKAEIITPGDYRFAAWMDTVQ